MNFTKTGFFAIALASLCLLSGCGKQEPDLTPQILSNTAGTTDSLCDSAQEIAKGSYGSYGRDTITAAALLTRAEDLDRKGKHTEAEQLRGRAWQIGAGSCGSYGRDQIYASVHLSRAYAYELQATLSWPTPKLRAPLPSGKVAMAATVAT